MKKKPCKDHLGNEYESVRQMTKAYGVESSTYHNRIERGLTVEQALTFNSNRKGLGKERVDHLGNKFPSLTKMAEYYDIPRNVLQNRLDNGWELERALTESIEHLQYDHKGNTYSSLKEMCDAYGVTVGMYAGRINRGWSQEDALTKDKIVKPSAKNATDHLGNVYPTVTDMLEHYGISRQLYSLRKKKGWSLEDTLTLKPKSEDAYKKGGKRGRKGIKCVDHTGQEFKSKSEMCKHWNLSIEAYSARIRRGMTIEEALTKPVGKQGRGTAIYVDHIGNQFNSLNGLCEYWNIGVYTLASRLCLGQSLEEALTTNKIEYCNEDKQGV